VYIVKLECFRGRTREYCDPESGEEYFSCSQLLHVLAPDLFSRVHYQTLELARQRGVDLHKYFFYALASHGRFTHSIPKHLAVGWEGYQRAILRFIAEWDPIPLLLEESSRDRKRGVGGTPDAKCIVRSKIALIDLKTGQPDRLHAVQANIYRRFEEYKDVQEMRTLYIRSDGSYDFPRLYRDPLHEAAADNALNILNWRIAA